MKNRYRLSSNAFEREDEEDKVEPQKIFFLSVEGNDTEKEYFDGISANRRQLGINAVVDVQVLNRRRKDTNSAPQQVVELLEEYLRLRENGKESLIEDIPESFIQKYGVDFIKCFLEDESGITKRQRNEFVTDLLKIGYDINYRKYLQKYNSDLDEFGILIDRDAQTHSELNMIECIKHCKQNKKNYLPNIDLAIERAKAFSSDEQELIDNIGCNIWKLIEAMKNYGLK